MDASLIDEVGIAKLSVLPLVVSILIASQLWAAEGPATNGATTESDRVEALVEECLRNRESQLEFWPEEIRSYRRILSQYKRAQIDPTSPGTVIGTGRVTFPTKEEKLAAIERAKQDIENAETNLAAIKSGERVCFPYLALPIQVGMVGRAAHRVNLRQVIDGQNMLVVHYTDVDRHELFWIRGIPTEGKVDGQGLEFDTALQVTGTESYTTVAGAQRTVFVLEPFDAAPVEELVRERIEQQTQRAAEEKETRRKGK